MKDTSPTIMKYKGYSALVRYSPEDKCLVGRLLGITDIVSFEGESVAAMRRELKVSVESYLEDCEEMGRAPDRPFSGNLNLRIPSTTHRALSIRAEAMGQSINDLIVSAVDSVLADA